MAVRAESNSKAGWANRSSLATILCSLDNRFATRTDRLLWLPTMRNLRPPSGVSLLLQRFTLSVLVTSVVLMSACGTQPSASRMIPAASTGKPSSSTTASGAPPTAPTSTPDQYCPGLRSDHALVLAWVQGDDSKVVVRDIQDPARGITLCALPGGSPRFVSASRLAIENPGHIFTFDLSTGTESQILSYVDNDGPVLSSDWSPDQEFFAYARLAQDGLSAAYHLVANGTDRLVTAVVVPKNAGIGSVRVEFSPDGKYVAWGVDGDVAAGERASVQIRRVDGSLVFGSAGTARLVWASESTALYFDDGSRIRAWGPINGVRRVLQASWVGPARSPDGRWLVYKSAGKSEINLMDTQTGAVRTIGQSPTLPEWVTASLVRFDQYLPCPTPVKPRGMGDPCPSKSVVYDVRVGTQSASVLTHVFATWPRGTPTWGR
jgi:hypothetical protein